MLEEFGEVVACHQVSRYSLSIGVGDFDFSMAFQVDHEIGKAEAVVPKRKFLLASSRKLWIYQFEALPMDLDVNDSGSLADLDGGDASAEAMSPLELMQGIRQVVQDSRRVIEVSDRSTHFPKEGVSQFDNCFHGHIEMVSSALKTLTARSVGT